MSLAAAIGLCILLFGCGAVTGIVVAGHRIRRAIAADRAKWGEIKVTHMQVAPGAEVREGDPLVLCTDGYVRPDPVALEARKIRARRSGRLN
jgi:ribosomal 50S subunit-recycling heat shock protein